MDPFWFAFIRDHKGTSDLMGSLSYSRAPRWVAYFRAASRTLSSKHQSKPIRAADWIWTVGAGAGRGHPLGSQEPTLRAAGHPIAAAPGRVLGPQ